MFQTCHLQIFNVGSSYVGMPQFLHVPVSLLSQDTNNRSMVSGRVGMRFVRSYGGTVHPNYHTQYQQISSHPVVSSTDQPYNCGIVGLTAVFMLTKATNG